MLLTGTQKKRKKIKGSNLLLKEKGFRYCYWNPIVNEYVKRQILFAYCGMEE